jgi:hypothetical protein
MYMNVRSSLFSAHTFRNLQQSLVLKMNSFYSRLFFLAMLLLQGGAQFPDIGCSKIGDIANANAGALQTVLNTNFGGPRPIDPPLPAGTYDTYTITFGKPSFNGCEVTITAAILIEGTRPDEVGSATIKATFEYDAGNSQVCLTDIEVVALDLPAAVSAENEAAILAAIEEDLQVPGGTCASISG